LWDPATQMADGELQSAGPLLILFSAIIPLGVATAWAQLLEVKPCIHSCSANSTVIIQHSHYTVVIIQHSHYTAVIIQHSHYTAQSLFSAVIIQ
jgi:hypothetical protein